MIGLGSNRLTVCRRGGMSVTQAGRGGMEWLAGSRVPSWASPYSAQATAALKEQFPTQWPTIQDYGFAHPEIVPYVNAYVTEDIKIIYSLVPTLGVLRRIKTDGNAYINTGIYVSMDDTVDAICAYGSVQAMPFGARGNSWGSEAICAASYLGDSPAKVTIGFYDAGGSTTVSSFVVVAGKDIHIVMKGTDNYWKLDGVSYGKTAGTSGVTLTRPIYLLAVNRGGSKYDSSQNYFTKFEVVGKHYLIPFIRNNVKGMLDMQTNTFHQNAGSGSFIISETPSPS